ncbi:MAG: [FeFe] hydrogenase H-cluster radical SAM maturase HydE [Clostridiales bacterium]|nr:[FeFe] hydrogenase H-cluster radical SAM maturase HydE [Clostridiales bacterium]
MINIKLIDKLFENQMLSQSEFETLINNRNEETSDYLFKKAREVRENHYGKSVYLRGLIEFSNYCKNDCLYCGIRRSNKNADRYRLSQEQIMECCEIGYKLGFRTFVLQSGEDPYYTDDMLCQIISEIRKNYSDCAITLSIGEKPKASYKRYKNAGADRYLLRHETASSEHYSKLHPNTLTLEARKKCIYDLKELGFQVGTGFMVGSPFQTTSNLVEDLMFLKELEPQMIGIGPFIPHRDTPFAKKIGGTCELTLFMLGLIRLILPKVLLPSTTALGTIDPRGREKGIMAGGNVVMPNLSPVDVRKKYLLYDNKICMGDEAAECRVCLQKRIESIGYEIEETRGDALK